MFTNLRSLFDLFRAARKLAAVCAFATIAASASAQTNTFPTTGNAGAGTTSPDRKLESLDSGSPQLRLTHTDGSVYTDFQTLSSGNLIISPTGPDTTSTKPFTVSAGSDAFRFYPTVDTNLRWALGTDASGLFHITQRGDGWAGQGTRFSINRSGNVGIGTTTPAYPLTINQTGNSINRILSLANDSSGSSAQAAVSFFEGATEKFKFGMNSSGATGYVGGVNAFQLWHLQNAPIVFGTNSSERMRIDGAGNIGIGTVSPTNAKLHIFSGGSGASEYTAGGFPELTLESGQNTDLYFLSPNTGSARLWFGSPSSNVAGGIMYFHNATPANGYMYFSAGNNSEKMRILGNGNIGIGTTAPASKLEVAGTIHSTAGGFKFPDGTVQTTAATGGGGGSTAFSDITAGTNTVALVVGNGGSFGVSGTGTINATSLTNAANITSGTVPITRLGTGTPDSTKFLRGDNTWTAITSSQWANGSGSINYTTGNVGIGTPSPIYSLDVNGGVNGFRAKAATTSGSDAIATFENGSGIQAIVRGNGNIGIGTTLPTAKLHVSGSGNMQAIVESTTAAAELDLVSNAAGSGKWALGTGWSSAGSIRNLWFYDNVAAAIRLTLDSSGNVGIGNSSPTEKLHVTGNGKFTGNLTVDGNINAKYQDIAEWVPSSEQLAAGTVVVLDTAKSNQVIASGTAYDTRVAGVISAQPGITLGESGEGKVLVATTGRVRVRIDASRGAVQIGDLLVTSDLSGVAMKSEAVNLGGVQIHRPGTIIGKALEPLAKGQGEILVLLSLQ